MWISLVICEEIQRIWVFENWNFVNELQSSACNLTHPIELQFFSMQRRPEFLYTRYYSWCEKTAHTQNGKFLWTTHPQNHNFFGPRPPECFKGWAGGGGGWHNHSLLFKLNKPDCDLINYGSQIDLMMPGWDCDNIHGEGGFYDNQNACL